jgi:hypothetical protein
MKPSKTGFIYILTNDHYKEDLLKIGMTTRLPSTRAKEIYEGHTGVPGEFTLAYKKAVSDCDTAETLIHKALSKYRVNNNREFFDIPLRHAIRITDDVCSDVSALYAKERDVPTMSHLQALSISPPVTQIGPVCPLCNSSIAIKSHLRNGKRICSNCFESYKVAYSRTTPSTISSPEPHTPSPPVTADDVVCYMCKKKFHREDTMISSGGFHICATCLINHDDFLDSYRKKKESKEWKKIIVAYAIIILLCFLYFGINNQ